jgi:hypothetical protein
MPDLTVGGAAGAIAANEANNATAIRKYIMPPPLPRPNLRKVMRRQQGRDFINQYLVPFLSGGSLISVIRRGE